jgi:riboflavin synthase
MFTGIVQGIASVGSVSRTADVTRLAVTFPVHALEGVQQGTSISLDGCCLTVTSFSQTEATFDLVPETIARTTFSDVQVGSAVNFERSLAFGNEVGGHILSGHVDVVAEVCEVRVLEDSWIVTFRVASEWTKYLFVKGYVAINGASLTLTSVDKETGDFTISLIPETLAKTNLGALSAGRRVNIEIDRSTQVIVDTVERVLAEQRLA